MGPSCLPQRRERPRAVPVAVCRCARTVDSWSIVLCCCYMRRKLPAGHDVTPLAGRAKLVVLEKNEISSRLA